MDVTVDKKGPCEAAVSFTVPAKEFRSQFETGLKLFGRDTRMKGFRAGKVPIAMLEKAFGDRARAETMEYFLRQAYQKAVEEHELTPAAHPQVQLDDYEMPESGDFALDFQLWLRPEIELGEYKGLEVEGASLEVTDEEIERATEDVRMQRATPEPVGEDGLPENGMALARVSLHHDGEEVFARDGLRITPDNPVQGVEADAFKEALVGSQDGDVHELPFTFPDEYEKEELRGKEGTCKVEVAQAFSVTPATDEEIVKLFGLEGPEQIAERVREEITKIKTEQRNAQIEGALLDQVIAAHPMELPAQLVQEQADQRLASMRAELQQQGLGEEEIDGQVAEQADAAYEAASKSMTAFFLIDSIAKAEDLTVGQQEMAEELHGIAQRNRTTFEEVRDYYQKEGLFQQLTIELLERKVRTFLRENAAIQES